MAEEIKTRRAPEPEVAKNARERGKNLAQLVCCWVKRWGYTSDQVLEYMYPPRPRLGYDLARRGLLKRHKRPPGVTVYDGPNAYSLSEAGYEIAEDLLPYDIMSIEHSAAPAWSLMQHLFDCQRIAIAFGMRPESNDWRSEPETRVIYTDAKLELIPDIVDVYYGHWIEYDRTPKKSDKNQLQFWVQQLARRLNQEPDILQKERGFDNFKIEDITVVVRKAEQVRRYLHFFNREYAPLLYKDRDTAKIKENRDKANQPIRDILDGRVEVITLDNLLIANKDQRLANFDPMLTAADIQGNQEARHEADLLDY